jgi:AAA+ ATPase superfamily predicted ATPase
MKTSIIGRIKEIEILDKILDSGKSEFLAVYGRRRVGKTFLIREYFDYKFDFQLTGLANATTEQQLINFQVAIQRQSNVTIDKTPKNWFFAFQILIDYLESIEGKSKKVIFLDELPWLDTAKSDFMIALEHFWNSWATNRKDIILISCGSAASWMINNLVNNHGGLHNRVTERMNIEPFTLRETELLLKNKNSTLNRYQIIQLYMVLGGIPFYLDAVQPDKSAAQNIELLCFRKGALLVTEFKNLFNSLFKNAEKHELVVRALGTKNKGVTRQEILKITGLKTGGSFTKVLMELEESGFINRYTPFNKKSKDTLYRLSDFYSFFYLKFIDKNTNFEEGVWVNAIDNSKQRTWTGFTFEQVCLTHIAQIKKALGINGVITQTLSWKSKSTENGAQIDLVIDRRDQVINICEIKYSINPYIITKSYNEQLRNKIGVFKTETKTRKAVFLTFITTYGLVKNQYASGLVQNEITMDALFEN